MLRACHYSGRPRLHKRALGRTSGVLAFSLFLGALSISSAQNARPLADGIQEANALLRGGQFPAAIQAYQRTLRSSPHNEKATVGLAAAYRSIFNYDEARRLLNDSVKRYPKSALALVELGKLDIHLQHYDDAIRDLSQAVRRQPELSSAHEQLGRAYQAKGDDDKALLHFNEAIRLNPYSASAHYFRGSLYADRDDYDRAYKDAQQAHDREPNEQSAALLAKTLTRLGKCKDAVVLLEPIAEPESSDPANLYLLSAAYKCAGQPDLAQKTQAEFDLRSKKAQQARTDTMEADHLASQAGEMARKNQLAAALDLIHRALEKDAENAATHALLAKIDFSREDLSQASEEISRALRKDPYNPDYLYVSGKVFEGKTDFAAALEAFQRTVLVNPQESDAYYEMAKIYLRQGRRLEAIQALKKAVRLSPEDADYRKALAETNQAMPR